MAEAICKQLATIRSNFATGLTLYGLLRTLGEDTIKRNRIILKEDGLYIVQPGQKLQIAPGESFHEVQFGGPQKWNINWAALEFSKMLLRNLTNDSFEVLYDYCEDTNQLPQMQSQPWYDFAHLVRNALTHNQRWLLDRPQDQRKLPVTWRGKIIDVGMHDQELSFEFYDWYDGVELWDEMYAFAQGLR